MVSTVSLSLPKRFEALEKQAKKNAADVSKIVIRVDDAANRLDELIRQAQDGGLGRFEVFLGKPGSGKTTFFGTLNRFFTGVAVRRLDSDIALSEIANEIRRNHQTGSPTVWFIHDRDNPEISQSEAERFAESLRPLFREDAGNIVLIWPITSEEASKIISEAAWKIGRDSIVDVMTRGVFEFSGIDKSKYYEVADLTVRNLVPSASLETFGLTRGRASDAVRDSETIGEFYSRLESLSNEINKKTRQVLKDIVIPRLWIVVPGDDNQALSTTISGLTQGRMRQVDTDYVLSYLDEEGKERAYLRQWKERRSEAAFLLRQFDVRVFELPANITVPALKVFGDDVVKSKFKSTFRSTSSARKALTAALTKSTLSRALNGDFNLTRPTVRSVAIDVAEEYVRVQSMASDSDQRLNRAIAEALKEAYEDQELSVLPENRLEGRRITPDITIISAENVQTCLEFTWRSTGREVEGMKRRQNTLSVGHIQMYVLEKTMEYVREYGL